VAVAGVGTTPLTISPGSLAFGSVNVGLASASQTIAIQNNQSVAAAITSLTFSGDFSRRAERHDLRRDASCPAELRGGGCRHANGRRRARRPRS
jgi:hypothetical protein